MGINFLEDFWQNLLKGIFHQRALSRTCNLLLILVKAIVISGKCQIFDMTHIVHRWGIPIEVDAILLYDRVEKTQGGYPGRAMTCKVCLKE